MSSHIFLFQAGGFLVSAQNHAIVTDRELEENVYPKQRDLEHLSLLEQVSCLPSICQPLLTFSEPMLNYNIAL